MSEKHPLHHEHSKNHEHAAELKEIERKSHEKSAEKAKDAAHEHKGNIENIRESIEKEALTSETSKGREKHSPKHEKDQSRYVSKELVDESYRRTLNRTRQHLSSPEKAFSKFIHNSVVDSVSELASKTVARPSGILAGGIFAFLGSSVFLWIARHYGYEYNFLLFAVLFLGGFFFGLLCEAIIRLALLRHRR